ncbi:unnamed protein product [Agarophyton chilense]
MLVLVLVLVLLALATALMRARHPFRRLPSSPRTAQQRRSARAPSVNTSFELPRVASLPTVAPFGALSMVDDRRVLESVLRCNCTRVAEALFKIVKLFGVRTLCDVPAASHVSWMLPVVKRLTFETPSFRYVAIDDDAALLRNVARRYEHVVDADFIPGLQPHALRSCDLLFYWPACGAASHATQTHSTLRVLHNAPAVLTMAKHARCALMLFAQAPSAPRNHTLTFRAGRWTLMNAGRTPLDRAPFVLNDFVKGAIPIGNLSHRDALYMTLYSLAAIPRAALPVSTSPGESELELKLNPEVERNSTR